VIWSIAFWRGREVEACLRGQLDGIWVNGVGRAGTRNRSGWPAASTTSRLAFDYHSSLSGSNQPSSPPAYKPIPPA
jgi:hypothetical protein